MPSFTSRIDQLSPAIRRTLSATSFLLMTAIFTLVLLALARVSAGMDMTATSQKVALSQNLRDSIGSFINNNTLRVRFIRNEPRFFLGVSGTELAGVQATSGTLRFADQDVVVGARLAKGNTLEQIFGSSTLKQVGVLNETATELDWLAIMNKKTLSDLPHQEEVRTVSTPAGLKLFLITATSTLDVFPVAIQPSLQHVGEETALDGVSYQTIALGSQLAATLQRANLPSKPHDRFENLLGKKAVVVEVLPETHTLLDEMYFVGSVFHLNGGM